MLQIRGMECQQFHTCWTFSIENACAPYWAFHGEITLPMTSWWRGLGCRTYQILSKWKDWHWQGIYYGNYQIDRPVWLCSGYPMEASQEEDVQVSSGDKHSWRICRRWESAGVVFEQWLVIGVGGMEKPRQPILQQEWEDLSLCK